MEEKKNFAMLSLLYQENAKIASIFWEWRHKLMTSFFTVIVALFALSGWFYQQGINKLVFAPLLIGIFLSLVLIVLDIRNSKILTASYQVGKDIETTLLEQTETGSDSAEDTILKNSLFKDGAIFSSINNTKGMIYSYTWTLRIAFSIMILFLGVISYLVYMNPLEKSTQQNVGANPTIEQLSKCLCKTE